LAKLLQGGVLAIAAACLFYAAPASADIELKAGCDGKWVERTGTGFETYKVCERQEPARPQVSALRMRGHVHRKLAHAKPHKHIVAHMIAHSVAPPVVVAAAPQPPKHDTECVALNCPQFLLVGIGY
jgi:hypothetical protein